MKIFTTTLLRFVVRFTRQGRMKTALQQESYHVGVTSGPDPEVGDLASALSSDGAWV